MRGVRGVTDLIVMPGLINLDFADIKSVISEMGKAMMGTGEAEGEDRASKAADMAISNPLLDDVSMKGAKGVLHQHHRRPGPECCSRSSRRPNRIRAEVDPDANIIFGNTILDDMEGRIRVSVVATGIDAEQLRMPEPKVQPLRPAIKPVAFKPEAVRTEPRSEPASRRGAGRDQRRPSPARGDRRRARRRPRRLARGRDDPWAAPTPPRSRRRCVLP
ncbi:MAG: hypothetical protein WDN08_13885, partial [Rhizomicrobium sp.]